MQIVASLLRKPAKTDMGRSKEYEAAFDRVRSLLEKEPRARERKNKNRAIGFIIRGLYPITLKGVDKEMVMAIVKQANTLDRVWHKVKEEHPALRGSDYKRKNQEEQEEQEALGYGNRPFHHTD